MFIPKFIIDQNLINSEIRTLNSLLKQQRQLKQTLAVYLNKISENISHASDDQNKSELISTLESIKEIFVNVKGNIDTLVELRQNLIASLKFDSYDSEYFEKYNENYMAIFNKISIDNSAYFTFMESFAKHITINFKTIIEEPQDTEIFENETLIDEILALEEKTLSSFDIEIKDTNQTDEFIINDEIAQVTPYINEEKVETSIKDEIVETSIIEKVDIESSVDELFNTIEKCHPDFTVIEDDDEENDENNKEEITSISEIELDDDTKIIEKTLIYSNNSIILPYSTEDLCTYFSNNPEKYTSLKDIIRKEYTIGLNDIKNTPKTRFIEIFNLAKNKSNLSLPKATSIASELSFNPNIDPVIVKACSSIEELDSYIDCMENNKLNKFNGFKILYK